jgi:hypothetical protein
METLSRHFATAVEIIRLPVAALNFHSHIDPVGIPDLYRYFTKPHPKYRIIQNKSVGAALIDLRENATRDAYLELIKGKNRGAYHAKRARTRGYVLSEIERNNFIDEIHAINTSVDIRQGRPMEQHYLQKVSHFKKVPYFKYFGMFDANGKLMAYANLGIYGDFCAFSNIIGHRNNDGIMHLMVVDIVSGLIEEGAMNYVMYDTFFGAQPGLRQFKLSLGFKPYRAKYRLT